MRNEVKCKTTNMSKTKNVIENNTMNKIEINMKNKTNIKTDNKTKIKAKSRIIQALAMLTAAILCLSMIGCSNGSFSRDNSESESSSRDRQSERESRRGTRSSDDTDNQSPQPDDDADSDSPQPDDDAVNPSLNPDGDNSPTAETPATISSNDLSQEEFTEFEAIDWEEGELGGIAFLGYADNVYDEAILREHDRYNAEYGYFTEGDISFLESEGDEIYLIIPRYLGSRVTVEEFNAEDGRRGTILLDTAVAPFMFRCNMSEIHPNSLITLRSQDEEFSFCPCIDLADNSIVLPEDNNGRIRDITLSGELTGGTWNMTRELMNDQTRIYAWELFPDGTAYYSLLIDETVVISVTERYSGTYYVSDGSDDYPLNTFVFDMKLEYVTEGELREKLGDTLSGAYQFTFAGPDILNLSYVEGDAIIFLQDSPEYFTYTYERQESAVG